MRQTHLFTKTRKEAPADEVSKNAQLLIRAGFIHKEMAGVYSYLPLGLRVLNNIVGIIREEMNAIGGQEILMTTLQDKTPWEKTNRWSDDVIDIWFKTNLKGGGELGLAPTNEEPVTQIATQHVQSYTDLPFSVYQFQTKFRNEVRAKSGIMRAREFLMKDLYSFHRDQKELETFYEQAAVAYQNVFDRAGVGDKTYKVFASGGAFSKYSQEFQTVCDAGEDIIYVDENKKIGVNKEVYNDEVLNELGLVKSDLVEKKVVEVGNIFKLGTRFSEPLGLKFKTETGEEQSVIMGTYGIGPGRLMGTIVELLSDDKGLIWPKEVSPFAVHLVRLGTNENVISFADELYADLRKQGTEVLYDDRDLRPGEKFADSDLIGIPIRFVISDKTVEAGKVEMKYRPTGESELVFREDAMKAMQNT